MYGPTAWFYMYVTPAIPFAQKYSDLTCLYQELLTGDVPFAHLKNDCQVFSVALSKCETPARPAILEGEDKEYLWSICQRCWRASPSERPGMEWISDALVQRTYEIEASTSSVPLVPQQESIAIPEEVRIRNDCNLNALKHILQVPSEAPDDSILQICKVFRLTSLQKVATPRDRRAAGKRIRRDLKYRSKALVAHPERDSASVFRDKGVNVRISPAFSG